MSYFVLLSDSTGTHQPQSNPEDPNLNPYEQRAVKEAIELGLQQGKELADNSTLGVIDESKPNAFFNFLCYTIAYNISCSFMEAQNLTLFDFISVIYIINKTNEKQEGAGAGGAPMNRKLR